MAETTGLVQKITIISETWTCVWIGPTPNNTEILLVNNDGSTSGAAYANTLIHILTSASTNYREVVAVHGNSDARITSIRIEPI